MATSAHVPNAVIATTKKTNYGFEIRFASGSPTIANGRVFTSYPARGRTAKDAGGKAAPPNATHAMAAFDLKTGKLLWQKWLDSGVMSAPVASGKFVYVSTFGGTLVKLDQASGEISYAIKARATSAPVIEFAADGLESMYFARRGQRRRRVPQHRPGPGVVG